MQHLARYSVPAVVVLTMSLSAVSVIPRALQRATMRRALDNWDILDLADHLNHAGLELRICSPQQDGAIIRWAYLTTTDKTWLELNSLPKDNPRRIAQWRGTVYLERMNPKWQLAFDVQDEHYLVVGSFVFYGDVELLERINAILTVP